MDKSICWYWWMKSRFYSWLMNHDWLVTLAHIYRTRFFLWFPISINLQRCCVTTPCWKLEVWYAVTRIFTDTMNPEALVKRVNGVFSYTFCVRVCTHKASQILTAERLQILYDIIWLYIGFIYICSPPPLTPIFWHCDERNKTKINSSSWMRLLAINLWT